MRRSAILPLGAALVLAACGGSDTGDDVALDDVAAAADAMPRPEPGQYRSTVELIDFDIPGMGDAMKQQMRAAAASGMAEGNDFCLTEEEAAEGPERMVQNMAESNCSFQRFNVSGGTMDAVMSCSGDGGIEGQVALTGTMSSTSSSITMEMNQDIPGAGAVQMKMKVDSERIGDCV